MTDRVSIVIVSHSSDVARGAAAMVRQVYGPKGVAVLVDLGGAETNSEMAIEMLPKDWQANVVVCSAPVVEGAVMAATEAAGGSSLAKVRATAEELFR